MLLSFSGRMLYKSEQKLSQYNYCIHRWTFSLDQNKTIPISNPNSCSRKNSKIRNISLTTPLLIRKTLQMKNNSKRLLHIVGKSNNTPSMLISWSKEEICSRCLLKGKSRLASIIWWANTLKIGQLGSAEVITKKCWRNTKASTTSF